MKKTILFICAVILIMPMCLVGCAAFDFAKQIIDAVKLPEQYIIEYEVTSEDGLITTVSKGKDAAGNYYFKSTGSETLYLKSGNCYEVYDKTNDQWVKRDNKVTEEYINDNTTDFDSYAERSREKFNGSFKEGDEVVCLGRNCKSYTLEIKIVNFVQSYEMLVDEKSGVCMRYVGVTSVSSNETGTSGFICTRFDVDGFDFSDIAK